MRLIAPSSHSSAQMLPFTRVLPWVTIPMIDTGRSCDDELDPELDEPAARWSSTTWR